MFEFPLANIVVQNLRVAHLGSRATESIGHVHLVINIVLDSTVEGIIMRPSFSD